MQNTEHEMVQTSRVCVVRESTVRSTARVCVEYKLVTDPQSQNKIQSQIHKVHDGKNLAIKEKIGQNYSLFTIYSQTRKNELQI